MNERDEGTRRDVIANVNLEDKDDAEIASCSRNCLSGVGTTTSMLCALKNCGWAKKKELGGRLNEI